jgi:hypothetical protein
MKEDPPPDFKCKDKFLVQSVAIAPERETLSLPELVCNFFCNDIIINFLIKSLINHNQFVIVEHN